MHFIARRHFLAGAGATILSAPYFPALASLGDVRSLALENLHTGERLTTEYWAQGQYIPDALAQVDHVLLDLLAVLRVRLETAAPFSVISGFRSPATNAMLRGEHEHSGVATKSLHMQGMAIDIRVPGRPLTGLRDIALAARVGGVGYYPASDFVHVDVGRVRRW